MSDRRDFLKKGALLGLAGLTGSLGAGNKPGFIENVALLVDGQPAFKLPALPYAYDALEPYIDKQTMEIHHGKHHQAYIDKLNNAPATGNIDYQADDQTKCRSVDQGTPMLIRNNLGGYYNHCLFWLLLKPNPGGAENLPGGELAAAIQKQFGSFDNFKKEFTDAAMKIFGSGWCWLIVQNDKIRITSTPNQDNPLMKVAQEQGRIVLALDTWEHAYYLKYQNKRADYVSAWWNIVNWKKAEELYLGL